jgi:hypothetical protein
VEAGDADAVRATRSSIRRRAVSAATGSKSKMVWKSGRRTISSGRCVVSARNIICALPSAMW